MTRKAQNSLHLLPVPGFTCFECKPEPLRVDLEAGADPVAAWRKHYQAEHYFEPVTVDLTEGQPS